MPATPCVNHPDRDAVGNCGHCHRFFCATCLSLDPKMQPICAECEKKAAAPGPAPVPAASPKPAVSPGGGLDALKHQIVDDDPLGLLGAPPMAAPKPLVGAVPPTAAPMPKGGTAPPMPQMGAIPPAPKVDPMPQPSAAPATPPARPAAPMAAPAVPGGLDDLFSMPVEKPKAPTVAPLPVKPPMPKMDPVAPKPTAPPPAAAIPVSLPDEDMAPKPKGPGFFAGLLRAHLSLFNVKIPLYALAGGFLLLLGVVGIVAASAMSGPSIHIAERVSPFHIVQVDASQVSDMDVTSYSDLQARLSAMQFSNFLQMTVPDLPSPNFFNVQMKPEVGTYAEIIKMPGQLKPVLSYVTVFTNGVWYSTNGWDGQGQEMEYLLSEFLPNDDADQLYVAHIQGLDKLKNDKGWETQAVNADRYMAALTDHVRWYLDLKGLAGFQAQFAAWH